MLALGVAALGEAIIDGTRQPRDRGELRGYRGDGLIAIHPSRTNGDYVRSRVADLAKNADLSRFIL